MEMSQNQSEPINEMETSINEEPHFDEIEENARTSVNEEPHLNEIEEKSGMDVDASSSNSVENVNELEQGDFSMFFIHLYFETFFENVC